MVVSFRIYLKKNKKRKGSWQFPPVWPYHRGLQRCVSIQPIASGASVFNHHANYNIPTEGESTVYPQGVTNIT